MKPGDKVRCINPGPFLVRGQVYTISDIVLEWYYLVEHPSRGWRSSDFERVDPTTLPVTVTIPRELAPVLSKIISDALCERAYTEVAKYNLRCLYRDLAPVPRTIAIARQHGAKISEDVPRCFTILDEPLFAKAYFETEADAAEAFCKYHGHAY